MLFGMLLSPWPYTALHFGLTNTHTFRVAHEFRAFCSTLLRHALCLRNLTLAKRTTATSGPTYLARFAFATLLCGARTPLRRLHRKSFAFCILLYPWPATYFGFASFSTFRVAYELWAFPFALLGYTHCLGNLTLAKRTTAASRPTCLARFALATLLCGARTPLRRLHRKSFAFCILLYPWPATYFGFASFSTFRVAYELWACLFALLRHAGCLGNLTLAKRTTATSRPTYLARFALATLLRGARTPLFGARLLRNFILLLFNKNTNVRKLWIAFLRWPQGIKMDLRKKQSLFIQGIVGFTPIPTYPYGKSLYKPYIVGIYGSHSPRILESRINSMGTLFGVHPIVPWFILFKQVVRDNS